MVKLLSLALILPFMVNVAFSELKCSLEVPVIPTNWIDLKGECFYALRNHVQKEIEASYIYLAMGAHFSKDTINDPGFAELFFEFAKEERKHGAKLIEYLLLRGGLTTNVTNLINVPVIYKHEWFDAASALEDALNLETDITKSIRYMIGRCERGKNYYHVVDYLTSEFLEEQLLSQRELAEKLNTLKKMMKNNGALGEFLFDKRI